MRNLILVIIGLLFFGCDKDMVNIVYGPPNVTGDQKVLIEEFTGVKCTFCPAGSDEIQSLIDLYPGKVIAVSIHSGFFATPVPNKSKLDLRTPDGDALYTFLGAGSLYPGAAFNRVDYNGKYISGRASWASNVQNLVSSSAKSTLTIQSTYDPDTKLLKVTLQGITKTDLNDNILANVLITESNIIDYQLDERVPGGSVDDYVHKHVLRAAAVAIPGETIMSNPKLGTQFSKEFTISIKDEWVPENIDVIGYISYSSSKEIIQVDETPLIK